MLYNPLLFLIQAFQYNPKAEKLPFFKLNLKFPCKQLIPGTDTLRKTLTVRRLGVSSQELITLGFI